MYFLQNNKNTFIYTFLNKLNTFQVNNNKFQSKTKPIKKVIKLYLFIIY